MKADSTLISASQQVFKESDLAMALSGGGILRDFGLTGCISIYRIPPPRSQGGFVGPSLSGFCNEAAPSFEVWPQGLEIQHFLEF